MKLRKRLFGLALLVLLFSGCTESTEHGECIGLGQDKDPAFNYRVDKSNAFVALIFVETLIVPIVIIADNILCPVSVK